MKHKRPFYKPQAPKENHFPCHLGPGLARRLCFLSHGHNCGPGESCGRGGRKLFCLGLGCSFSHRVEARTRGLSISYDITTPLPKCWGVHKNYMLKPALNLNFWFKCITQADGRISSVLALQRLWDPYREYAYTPKAPHRDPFP